MKIMKYIFLLLTIVVTNLNAQNNLKFDKRFVECEDRWVAFTMDKDSSYAFGFIYIDSEAGLTLNYEGTFKILESGIYSTNKVDTAFIKYRLKPNNVLVALIPENKFEELKIQGIPDWLKFYKTDTSSIERLYRWGYLYNGWNECTKALTYLEQAYKINPKFKGLEVELAFSYNCLGLFDKAIFFLQAALKENPNDAYSNKELVYAQIKSGQLDKAAESCKNAIEICTDKSYNGENCYNLLHEFYINGDKENFKLWLDETKKWTKNNSKISESIKIMENELFK